MSTNNILSLGFEKLDCECRYYNKSTVKVGGLETVCVDKRVTEIVTLPTYTCEAWVIVYALRHVNQQHFVSRFLNSGI